MHGYIYDIFIGKKNYQKEIIKIENSLTDHGLKGHTIRLTLINNVGHAINELIRKGVTTITAVGSDQLFSKIADFAEQLDGITLGLIPMGNHQQLAKLFGISEGVAACDTLAARLVRNVPLGKINNSYFIHSAVINDPEIRINCEHQFILSPTSTQAVTSIINLKTEDEADQNIPSTSKKKGSLSIIISPVGGKSFFKKGTEVKPTYLQSKAVIIDQPKNIPILVDGQKVLKTPAVFEVVPQKIKVIMGKERKFS